jgi:hypothetical protein
MPPEVQEILTAEKGALAQRRREALQEEPKPEERAQSTYAKAIELLQQSTVGEQLDFLQRATVAANLVQGLRSTIGPGMISLLGNVPSTFRVPSKIRELAQEIAANADIQKAAAMSAEVFDGVALGSLEPDEVVALVSEFQRIVAGEYSELLLEELRHRAHLQDISLEPGTDFGSS